MNGKGASDLPLRLIRRRGLPTFTVRLWGSLLRVNSRFSQADNSLHRGGNSFILPQPQPLQQYHHQIQIQILLFAAYASMTVYNQPSGGIKLAVKGAASKAMKFCCGNEYTLVGNLLVFNQLCNSYLNSFAYFPISLNLMSSHRGKRSTIISSLPCVSSVKYFLLIGGLTTMVHRQTAETI